MNEPDAALPEPELEPRPITLDEYRAFTPEKLELFSGYLVAPPDDPDERLRLLRILLVNVGLVEAVRSAPEARWREALARAFPRGG